MNRRECLELLASLVDEHTLTVTSLSSNAAIWSSLRRGCPDFFGLNMGLCLPFAIGLCLAFPRRRVIALESDGSLLLDASSLITAADVRPPNLLVLVFDNEAYARMGPTATARAANLELIARGAGIEQTATLRTLDEFGREVRRALTMTGPSLLVVKVAAERERLGSDRRRTYGAAMREAFIDAVLRHPDYGAWRQDNGRSAS